MRDTPVDEAELRRLIAEGEPDSTAGSGTPSATASTTASGSAAGRPGSEPGRDTEPGDGLAQLAALLNAASAAPPRPPATDGATAPGEQTALTAFRSAYAAAASRTASRTEAASSATTPARPGLWRRLSRCLSRRGRTTALGFAATALLGGGVAVASGLGPQALSPHSDAAPDVTSPEPSPESSPVAPAPLYTPHTPRRSPTAPGPVGPGGTENPAETPDSAATRLARLTALCRALNERPPRSRERALEKPGFRPLVEAAGSPEAVSGYCAARPGTPATEGPATPSGEESGQPATRGRGESDRPGLLERTGDGTGGQGLPGPAG